MGVPTAKEYLLDKERSGMSVSEMFIGFAKLHCEAQSEAIIDSTDYEGYISREEIINAYPITNIK